MKSFKEKKQEKAEKKLKENLSNELTYDDLNSEDKEKFDVVSKKRKYSQYATYGLVGVTMAVALINGHQVLDGCLYDTAISFTSNVQYIVAASVEQLFINSTETIIRFAALMAPACLMAKIANYQAYCEGKQAEILNIQNRSRVDRFLNYIAKRSVNRKKNKENKKNKNNVISEDKSKVKKKSKSKKGVEISEINDTKETFNEYGTLILNEEPQMEEIQDLNGFEDTTAKFDKNGNFIETEEPEQVEENQFFDNKSKFDTDDYEIPDDVEFEDASKFDTDDENVEEELDENKSKFDAENDSLDTKENKQNKKANQQEEELLILY
ncbi:MAG: hypothetical protein ACI4TX_04080 [Christensenellales bacterium]